MEVEFRENFETATSDPAIADLVVADLGRENPAEVLLLPLSVRLKQSLTEITDRLFTSENRAKMAYAAAYLLPNFVSVDSSQTADLQLFQPGQVLLEQCPAIADQTSYDRFSQTVGPDFQTAVIAPINTATDSAAADWVINDTGRGEAPFSAAGLAHYYQEHPEAVVFDENYHLFAVAVNKETAQYFSGQLTDFFYQYEQRRTEGQPAVSAAEIQAFLQEKYPDIEIQAVRMVGYDSCSQAGYQPPVTVTEQQGSSPAIPAEVATATPVPEVRVADWTLNGVQFADNETIRRFRETYQTQCAQVALRCPQDIWQWEAIKAQGYSKELLSEILPKGSWYTGYAYLLPNDQAMYLDAAAGAIQIEIAQGELVLDDEQKKTEILTQAIRLWEDDVKEVYAQLYPDDYQDIIAPVSAARVVVEKEVETPASQLSLDETADSQKSISNPQEVSDLGKGALVVGGGVLSVAVVGSIAWFLLAMKKPYSGGDKVGISNVTRSSQSEHSQRIRSAAPTRAVSPARVEKNKQVPVTSAPDKRTNEKKKVPDAIKAAHDLEKIASGSDSVSRVAALHKATGYKPGPAEPDLKKLKQMREGIDGMLDVLRTINSLRK